MTGTHRDQPYPNVLITSPERRVIHAQKAPEHPQKETS